MFHFIKQLLIINPKNAYKIKNYIFKQSRISNLYISFNIRTSTKPQGQAHMTQIAHMARKPERERSACDEDNVTP